MKRSNLQYIAPKLVNFILIMGVLAFEVFNITTTASALESMVPVGMGVVLAIAFCATDIAGLVRVITPVKTMKDEPAIVRALFAIWFMVAIINAFLTWFSLQIYFDVTEIRVPIVMRELRDMIPFVLAFVVFMIHFTVVYSLGVFLERGAAFQDGYRSLPKTERPAERPTERQYRPVAGNTPLPPRSENQPSMFNRRVEAVEER